MKNDPISPEDAAERNRLSRKLVHDMRNAVAPIRNAVQLLRFRVKADPGLAPITDMIERQVSEIVRMLNVISDAEQPARSGTPSIASADNDRGVPVAGRTGRNVLIADDNLDLLTSLSGVLREAGHHVKTAADGAAAVEVARDWQPDFILLDVNMPRMNGFEAAKQLRALYPPDVTKLVLMSGSSLDETTLRGAERAGFDHCLDKVHDLAELEKLLSGNA